MGKKWGQHERFHLYTFGKMTWSNLTPFFLRKIPTRKPQESQNCWIVFCVLDNGTLGSLSRGKKNMMMVHIWWSLQGWHTSVKYQGVHAWYIPLVHQTCCNTSLRVGSTGSVVRPILWTDGMMLGSWVFRWHTEKTRWFSEGFRTNYKNLNRPHVKMCFRKGNLPKHGLNLGWSWKTISNSFFQIFFGFFALISPTSTYNKDLYYWS